MAGKENDAVKADGDEEEEKNKRNQSNERRQKTKSNSPFYYLFRGSEFHRLYRRHPRFET